MKRNHENDEKPIGVFDSGIGGLTVLKELHKILPDESTIYLGDTARVPYGIRSPETVIKYSLENSSFLIDKGIKLLVIACNTASATCLDIIRKTFSIPIIGVIEPGARAAVRNSKSGKIGVIGTETTIKSKAYRREIHKINNEIEIYEKCCPLFVPLVEEGWLNDNITELIAGRYLKDMSETQMDSLVLGCTHYPLLKDVIRKVVDKNTLLVDSAIETAIMVKDMLDYLDLTGCKNQSPVRKYYVTDSPERFIRIGKKFLGEPIDDINLISINALEMAAI
ncbi:glutamate racemase [Candidatus Magnetoovum chiemensis]|nr:glutamate racemase [Candidatus Magnetoovum chiemensis]